MATSAIGADSAKPRPEGVESSRSETAQQLSASACVTTRWELEGESDVCIGQLPIVVQQAIRAAGVACHPAHNPRLLAESARLNTIPVSRLLNVST